MMRRKVKESEKVYLKNQRNAALWWEPRGKRAGHKLCGRINGSLTNQIHRRAIEEVLDEVERQLHHSRDRR